MATTRTPITIMLEGRRHVFGVDSDSYQVWRLGRFRRARISRQPRTIEGHAAVLHDFMSVEPGLVRELPPPGRLMTPRRVTRGGLVALTVVTVIVVGFGVAGSVALARRSDRTEQRAGSAISISISTLAPTAGPGGSGAAAAPTVGNSQPGWVYADDTSTIFIQWTRADTSLTGSLTMSSLADVTAQAVTTENDAFTGVIDKDSVNLSLPQGFGIVTNLTARTDGSNLVVSWPQEDGTLLPLSFARGTATEYNADLASLQQTAAGNVQAAQSAAAAAAAASASASAQAAADEAVDDDSSALIGAVDTVTTGDVTAVNGDVTSTASDVTTMRTDLATTQSDAQKVRDEAGSVSAQSDGTECTDAYGVGADADGVGADQDGIQADLIGLTSSVATLSADLATITTTQQSLASAIQDDPGYSPTSTPPTTAAVNAARSLGQAALSGAASAVSADTSTTGSMVNEANAASASALKAGNC